MSHKAIDWAWDQDVRGTQKLVLLCLANWADAAHETWPAMKTIAAMCSVSERAAREALRELERRRVDHSRVAMYAVQCQSVVLRCSGVKNDSRISTDTTVWLSSRRPAWSKPRSASTTD
jgi:hypothetical protein